MARVGFSASSIGRVEGNGGVEGMNKHPLCPQCRKYLMIRSNCAEWFCTKCGYIGMPEMVDLFDLMGIVVKEKPAENAERGVHGVL